jgi:hypothetical protein
MPSTAFCSRRARRNASFHARGSVLLVALLLAIGIAISLTSYIKLVLTSANLADRSYYQNAAVNLAEIGVEEALHCYNKLGDVPIASPQDAWTPTGWTVAVDNSATRTLSGYTLGPNVTAVIRVHCSLHNPTTITDTPVIVSKVTVTFPNGPEISKFVEVTLRKRTLFPRGMVVRQTIDADGGNLSLDSWDSMDDGDPSTAIVPYSTTSRRANATLATISTANGAIDIGNGNVYGYILTNGGTVNAGPTAILTGDFASTEFDSQRISNDFEVTAFPTTDLPSSSYTNQVTSSLGAVSLPRVTDTPAADGTYYYNFAPGAAMSLNNGTVQINGKVVIMLVNHAGVSAMTIGGTAGMNIASGAALKVYSNGNISITGGGGLSNGNSEPATCVFFGTHVTAGSQSLTLNGNGHTSVALYAPNAAINMSGGGSGGDFYGAIVGNTVRMNGTTRFHYDEALARLYPGKAWGISKWRELRTSVERDAFTAQLNF